MSTMNSRSALPRARNETAFEAHLARNIRGEPAGAVRRPGFVPEKYSRQTASRRFDPFAISSGNDRYLRILLKKSEIEVPRKSRFRAHSVDSTSSYQSSA